MLCWPKLYFPTRILPTFVEILHLCRSLVRYNPLYQCECHLKRLHTYLIPLQRRHILKNVYKSHIFSSDQNMWRVPKKGGFLRKGRFYRRSDRNGPSEREFREEGKAASPIIYNNYVRNICLYCFNEKSNSKTIKRHKNWKPIFFRENPLSSVHVTYDKS